MVRSTFGLLIQTKSLQTASSENTVSIIVLLVPSWSVVDEVEVDALFSRSARGMTLWLMSMSLLCELSMYPKTPDVLRPRMTHWFLKLYILHIFRCSARGYFSHIFIGRCIGYCFRRFDMLTNADCALLSTPL